MRLRWTIALAFIALALLQVAVVVPLALRNLSRLLSAQQEARVDQMMVAVEAETTRLKDGVRTTMDELAQSQALEDVAKDAAKVPPPPHVTTAAATLMRPRNLDVLALLDDEGRTLSSGHLPARLGEPDDPLFQVTKAPARQVSPREVELSSAQGLVQAPAIVTARAVDYGDRRVWAVGGVLLDEGRAKALARLTGARVEVHARDRLVTAAGELPRAPVRRSLAVGEIAEVRLFFSGADLLATRSEVLRAFLALAALGLVLAIVAGFFISRRVTRPVEALTGAARKIAEGTPGVHVEPVSASGELATLITTFNRMTDDLKTATDRLVASERIAAWQEVARRLAHEIKNPLTPIRMSLETLLAASQRGPVDERFMGIFKESAHAVLEEVDRLKRIVDEFSQFARLPRPVLAPLELSELTQQVMSLYAPHDGLTYVVELEPGLRVSGDRDQLTQVLVNLVKNAEEAMAAQGGGTVTVRTSSKGRDAVLEVADSGPGIPAELKPRLFEPYVTSKPQGTGLGLAIALRIAQEHEGVLVAEDANPGARFRLSLPRIL
ncbi:MAG: HAMP domain-containing protein [Myxococcaceae bacterium]|nr:HAMP domain-containing protein [Myxococcaceae bacterium]